MQEILQTFKTWAPVLVPVLALLAGTGWLQYFLARRREKQEMFRAILERFLLPFEAILKINYKVFNELRDDREISALEYHPGSLQHYFSSLPDNDPRKLLWKSRIERLQEANRRAVELIGEYRGSIVTEKFKVACDDFIYHAEKWEDMWKALAGTAPVPPAMDEAGVLYAPRFPDNLEAALHSEMAEVKRQAGRKE